MLQFDPSRRIDVDEALKHPYLMPLHDPTDEVRLLASTPCAPPPAATLFARRIVAHGI